MWDYHRKILLKKCEKNNINARTSCSEVWENEKENNTIKMQELNFESYIQN